MPKTFYKYRTIDNFKYFVDIILNQRLFAGNYKSMNDPMEGVYLYTNGILNQSMIESLHTEKNAINFCCLSEDKDNYLMWSHYANGHRGVAIGVQINQIEYDIRNIEYYSGLTNIDRYDNNTAREILSRKLNLWEYEKEVRIFPKNNSDFILVTVKEVILGIKMELEDEILIRKLVENINQNIIVTKNHR